MDTLGKLIEMEMRIQRGNVGLRAGYWDGGDGDSDGEKMRKGYGRPRSFFLAQKGKLTQDTLVHNIVQI